MSKHTPEPFVICTDDHPCYGSFFNENANLIAAAPELLEALEDLLSFVAFIEDPVVLKAREAIAKATGE